MLTSRLDNQRRHLQTFPVFKNPEEEKEGEAVPLKETDINKVQSYRLNFIISAFNFILRDLTEVGPIVILSDPRFKEDHARCTTVPLTFLSDQ